MPKSLDQVQTEQYVENSRGVAVDPKDVELAVRMTIKALKDGGGLDVIRNAVNQSQDPAQVIGQMLAQIAGKLGEKLQQQYGVDPRIFLAKDGWLEQILDWIEKQLGYPKEFSDQIYQQVLETIKAAAQRPEAPNDVAEMGEVSEPAMPNTPGAGTPGIPRQPGGNY